MRSRLSAWSNVASFTSGFWWLWSSTLVNYLGMFVYPFLTLYLTVARGYSPVTAGLVVSCVGLGSTAGSVLGGELSDRMGRRTTLIGPQLASAAATAALGVVSSIPLIVVLTLILGVGMGVGRPAVSAMITDLVPPQDRQRAFTVNYWAINIGFGLSAILAGFVVELGYIWLFAGDAATTMACAVITVVKLKETRPEGPANGSRGRKSPRAGTRQVLRDTRFLLANRAGLHAMAVVVPGAEHARGGDEPPWPESPRDYGLVFSANGLLIVLLQIPVPRLVAGRREGRLLAGSALLYGCGFGLTALAGNAALLHGCRSRSGRRGKWSTHPRVLGCGRQPCS